MSYFKYVSEEVALKIFQCQRIRITQASQLNDPFEVLPAFSFIQPKNNKKRTKFLNDIQSIIPDTQDYQSAHRTIYRALNNEINFFSEELNFIHVIRALQNCVGILSLTNKNDNILMWSHYANNHKDIVIEFDDSHEFFNQSIFNKPFKVSYKNKRVSKSSLNVSLQDLFKYKSQHWKYEDEIRMFFPVKYAGNFNVRINSALEDGKDYNIYLFDIPKDLIKAVYFGVNSNIAHLSEKKKQLIDIISTNYTDLKIYHGRVCENGYAMRFD